MGNVNPIPVPQNDLDVRIVRINEQEGIIQNLVIVSVDYQVVNNDCYIVADTACTVTLPNVNTGKLITVKSTVSGTITIDGGDFNIDGAATIAMTTQYESTTLLFNGLEWSIVSQV